MCWREQGALALSADTCWREQGALAVKADTCWRERDQISELKLTLIRDWKVKYEADILLTKCQLYTTL